MIVRPVNRLVQEGKFMNDAETVNTRIDQLETRIAHQDRTIEDLNKSVTEQWRQIDEWRGKDSLKFTQDRNRGGKRRDAQNRFHEYRIG